jgi:hypothetical protein
MENEMTELLKTRDEINDWFFSEYFIDFVSIGARKVAPDRILKYWGAPLHMSGPAQSRWVESSEEVVRVLKEMQAVLKRDGYTHTEVLDRKTTIMSENAGRIETIMSRRRADGVEIDRTAIAFEIRRAKESWIIISAAAGPG